mmetsp:Transcript_34663/g.83742  ORF Transcript_34663/g.83742 Transcript_34663/m.83742 type:complete len:362 (+) Transcript_34663:63-1148(+)
MAAPNEATRRQAEIDRYTALIEEAARKLPQSIAPHIVKLAPTLAKAAVAAKACIPILVTQLKKLQQLYEKLPRTVLKVVCGFVLCFFGGVYPTLIATVEAFRQCGWDRTRAAMKELAGEAKAVLDQEAADNKKDADGNGVPDVQEITPQELLVRKTHLVMSTCDPEKVSRAMGGLYTSWIAVLAVLKVRFAKTVALSMSVANVLCPEQTTTDSEGKEHPITGPDARPLSGPAKVLRDSLQASLPPQYQKWLDPLVRWIVKAVSLSVAWTLMPIMHATHSSIRGGMMCSRALLQLANEKQVMQDYLPKDHQQTKLDEVAGWSLALVGFAFQWKFGFRVPFPLRLFMLPLDAVEGSLRWTVGS